MWFQRNDVTTAGAKFNFRHIQINANVSTEPLGRTSNECGLASFFPPASAEKHDSRWTEGCIYGHSLVSYERLF